MERRPGKKKLSKNLLEMKVTRHLDISAFISNCLTFSL